VNRQLALHCAAIMCPSGIASARLACNGPASRWVLLHVEGRGGDMCEQNQWACSKWVGNRSVRPCAGLARMAHPRAHSVAAAMVTRVPLTSLPHSSHDGAPPPCNRSASRLIRLSSAQHGSPIRGCCRACARSLTPTSPIPSALSRVCALTDAHVPTPLASSRVCALTHIHVSNRLGVVARMRAHTYPRLQSPRRRLRVRPAAPGPLCP
jgi:hypothetical protein